MGLSMFLSNCGCDSEKKTVVVHCDCDTKIKDLERRIAKLPNPDPHNYKIISFAMLGKYLIAMVNYPDCTNYEGNKIMVFEGINITQFQNMDFIDPHFCNGPYLSPVARFEPTDRGWEMACKLIKMLSDE